MGCCLERVRMAAEQLAWHGRLHTCTYCRLLALAMPYQEQQREGSTEYSMSSLLGVLQICLESYNLPNCSN